jgi:hypothetical protein
MFEVTIKPETLTPYFDQLIPALVLLQLNQKAFEPVNFVNSSLFPVLQTAIESSQEVKQEGY